MFLFFSSSMNLIKMADRLINIFLNNSFLTHAHKHTHMNTHTHTFTQKRARARTHENITQTHSFFLCNACRNDSTLHAQKRKYNPRLMVTVLVANKDNTIVTQTNYIIIWKTILNMTVIQFGINVSIQIVQLKRS